MGPADVRKQRTETVIIASIQEWSKFPLLLVTPCELLGEQSTVGDLAHIPCPARSVSKDAASVKRVPSVLWAMVALTPEL